MLTGIFVREVDDSGLELCYFGDGAYVWGVRNIILIARGLEIVKYEDKYVGWGYMIGLKRYGVNEGGGMIKENLWWLRRVCGVVFLDIGLIEIVENS